MHFAVTCGEPDALVMLAAVRPSVWAWRLGIGWDTDLPFSLLPAAHTQTLTKGGLDTCWAWLGLFVGYTRVPPSS